MQDEKNYRNKWRENQVSRGRGIDVWGIYVDSLNGGEGYNINCRFSEKVVAYVDTLRCSTACLKGQEDWKMHAL